MMAAVWSIRIDLNVQIWKNKEDALCLKALLFLISVHMVCSFLLETRMATNWVFHGAHFVVTRITLNVYQPSFRMYDEERDRYLLSETALVAVWTAFAVFASLILINSASNVYVDLTAPLAFTSSRFTSFNFDWHKDDEEPPLWLNCSVQLIDLQSPALHSAVQGLKGRLRIGGSEEDDVVYNVTGNECEVKGTDPAFCLSMDRWKEIVQFTSSNDIDLVFGLNAMDRADNDRAENFSNIESFLQFTFDEGLKVWGFEFGNELPAINEKVDAADFISLYNLIQSIWNKTGSANRDDVPRVCGNDLNPDPSYIEVAISVHGQMYVDIYM